MAIIFWLSVFLFMGILIALSLYCFLELSSWIYTDLFTQAAYIPNDKKIIAKALELVNTGENDILYDLGSGDGRTLLIGLQDFNVKKAIGYEWDFFQTFKAKWRLILKGFSRDRFSVKRADIFKTSFADADVLYLYLYPHVLEKLKPQFADLKKGTRIVSCRFAIPGMVAEKEVPVTESGKYIVYTYLV